MDFERALIAKVAWRLVPLLILAYFVAFLDRVNVSFAAIQMNADLGLSSASYGFGAGIFFVFYVLFEVPSNIILAKVGARRWIARIILTWGVLSCGMALVQGEYSFYAVRALLGAAEAGFFPGIVYYLSLWFPSEYRGRISSYFMLAIPMSTVIGAPISGFILSMNGILGFKGWQWLFLLEGLPAILLGFVVLFYLTDRPAAATWLLRQEREWLTSRMDREAEETTFVHGHPSIVAALRNPFTWALGLVCFGAVVTNYGVGFFLPQIITDFGWNPIATGFAAALPYAVGAVGMVWWGRHSDASGERKMHTAIAIAVASGALAISTLLNDPYAKLLAISCAGFGMVSYLGPFWTIPSMVFRGPALAAAIAAINAIASCAGFAGPYIMGYVRGITGSFQGGLLSLSILGAVGMVTVLLLPIGRSVPQMRADARPVP
jgi:ACS family tartrate transporter-like MFS transporter